MSAPSENSGLRTIEDAERDVIATHCLSCGYWLRGLSDQGRCPECGIPYDKYWGVWRQGMVLVMGKSVRLPRRCVFCNAQVADLNLKRYLTWFHPAWYLLILLNLLIFILVAVIVSKKATVRIGLCPVHYRKRRVTMAVGWLIAIASLSTFIAAAIFESLELVAVGVGLLLALLVFLMVAWRNVSAKRISRNYVWLRGVHRDFLEQLPELNVPLD